MLKRVFILMLAAAGLVAAPYASAEMKGYVSGGLGFNGVASDVVITDPAATAETLTYGKSNFSGQIEGGVRFAHSSDENIIFGIGLYINPFTLKAHEDGGDPPGASTTIDIVDMRGLVGEIGWKLGTATVAYGKLSLNQGRMEGTFITPPEAVGPITQSFSGVGIGAGFRQSLADNMYLFSEWHHIMGGEVSIVNETTTYKIKPKLTTGLVGAGWTF